MRRTGLAVVLFGLLLAGTAAGGDVPGLLTTQGVLRSPGGSPVNGVYAITFRIYSAQTGGQLLWSETRPAVAVSAGLYSEVLGTINPIPTTLFSSTANAWMTLSIAGEPELPRSQITSVAFALHARSALTAGTATNAETAETADFAAATDIADNAFNLQCTGCVSKAELAFEVVTPQEVGPIALDAVDDAGIYLPVTGGGISGGLDVAGVVTAAAFVGNGSGLTGISSPQGACANGWLVSGITAAGVLVCTKAATAVTSVDGLAGGTIAGDLDVTGSVTSEGSLVCTEAGNCPDADSLAELLCEAGDVPVWDGDAWICGAVAQTLPGAPCQDGTSVLTWTGDAFGCKLITGIGPSAGAAQGFEVRDEWGYSWDGLMRPLATYTSAAAACEAAGARLPTPTELFRVSQVKSKLFGTLASTDFLWSAVQFSASGHVAVNLSTAEVSYTVDSAARPYRCVWPDNKATSFTGDYCYGPAGAECFPLTLENDRYVIDRYDRIPMNLVAAVNECRFFYAHVPDAGEYTQAIKAGLGDGANAWNWVSDGIMNHATYRYHTTFKWSGVNLAFDASNSGGYSGASNRDANLPFRCMGSKENQGATPVVVANAWTGSRSSLTSTTQDEPTRSWHMAVQACLDAGGHLPTARDFYELVNDGLPNGTNNWLWTVDQIRHQTNVWYTEGVRWLATTTGLDPSSSTFTANLTKSSSQSAFSRCVWYPVDKQHTGPLPGACTGGCFALTVSAGTTPVMMWADSEDRPATTWAAANQICYLAGARLASLRDLTELVRKGLPNGTNSWLWLADFVTYYSVSPVQMQVAATRWTGTQSSFDGYDLNQFEVTASGTQKFRCVWTNELR